MSTHHKTADIIFATLGYLLKAVVKALFMILLISAKATQAIAVIIIKVCERLLD